MHATCFIFFWCSSFFYDEPKIFPLQKMPFFLAYLRTYVALILSLYSIVIASLTGRIKKVCINCEDSYYEFTQVSLRCQKLG